VAGSFSVPESSEVIGILAIQGAFAKHAEKLQKLGMKIRLVRNAEDLNQVDRLVIPGGESTAMVNMLKKHQLWEPLRIYCHTHPVLGTCAGIILMANKAFPSGDEMLSVMDVSIERNQYGRQQESFMAEVDCFLDGVEIKVPAFFIRAPVVLTFCKEKVRVLARYQNIPVLLQQERSLAMTFHPELTNNTRILEYFLSL
jgi:5'-phosphate synthase pdxT subunit